MQWIQASLPVKDGGLGVRCVSSLALPAFLASAVTTLFLQEDIFLAVPALIVQFYRHICLSGRHNMVLCQKCFLQSNHSGIAQVSCWTKQWLSRVWSHHQFASFLAALSLHSDDWLVALPIASCGLKLDDEAVRIGVGLILGLPIWVPHQCRCGSLVDTHGLHSFVCKCASASGTSARLDCSGLCFSRYSSNQGTSGPVTVIWEATRWLNSDSVAGRQSFVVGRHAKYTELESHYLLQPVAVESLSPLTVVVLVYLFVCFVIVRSLRMSVTINWFLSYLILSCFLPQCSRSTNQVSVENREGSFLYQR